MANSTIGQRAKIFDSFMKKLDDIVGFMHFKMKKASLIRFKEFWA